VKNLLKLSEAAVVAMGTVVSVAMADVTFKVAYENNPGDPTDVVFKKWAKDLDEQSGGTIKLEPYPGSQLGSHQDVTEQALFGGTIVTISDVGFWADFIPDLSFLAD
jgi:TRAP-type C4-dicarboxylate transport system substrate-binding protein